MYRTFFKVGENMLVDINLLPKKEKKKSSLWLFLVLILLVVGLVGFYMWQMYNKQVETKNELEAKLTNVKVEEVTIESKAAKPDRNDAVDKLKTAIQWANENQSSTYSLLRNISSLLPTRGFIMDFSFQNNGSATLSVQFDSSREAAFYLKSLSTSAFIDKAELVNIQTEKMGNDASNDVLPRYTADYQLQVNISKLKQKGEVTP
jgi:type IV pilus assembly protein PilN